MSVKQMAITTATVMALVVIVTLLKVGLGGRDDRSKEKSNEPSLNKPHLTVSNPSGPVSPPYAEIGHEGHHDYWFTNDNDAPVEVFVSLVSCGRCITIQVGLAPEGVQATAVPGADVTWVTLESEESKHDAKGFTVPAKTAGWVRLGWNYKDTVAEELLRAFLRTTCSTGRAPPIELKVQVRFIDPVRPLQAKLALDPIRTGSDKPETVWFQVFSVTRDRFDLEPESAAQQKKRNPFVTCGLPVALTDAECRNLEKETRLPVRCGYKMPVTVREYAEGREHDFGPFSATVVLKSDALINDMNLAVTGSVEGIVDVLCGETKDQIALGAFPRSTGTRRTATIETREPGDDVTVKIDRVPEFLNVELMEQPKQNGDARKQWNLSLSVRVKVLTDANMSGSFGNLEDQALGDTAIYLKANGRRLRIPVTGSVIPR